MRLAKICGALLLAVLCVRAQPPRFVVEAVGTERAAPDLIYLLMKMEYDAGQARDATAAGEKQLREFLSAVEALKIAGISWRVSNNVLNPANTGVGITYSRNVIFTLPVETVAARDPVIARLEDVGARFNSRCVTCIGSG